MNILYLAVAVIVQMLECADEFANIFTSSTAEEKTDEGCDSWYILKAKIILITYQTVKSRT